jgi:hypothetical protein
VGEIFWWKFEGDSCAVLISPEIPTVCRSLEFGNFVSEVWDSYSGRFTQALGADNAREFLIQIKVRDYSFFHVSL